MAYIFSDADGNHLTESDFVRALLDVGADQCEILFIHSDIMFGTLTSGIRRNELIGILYEQIKKLNVCNIIIPTFTYSFPNGEDYDIVNSKTFMGAFNEYVRKIEGRYRTDDPLLSVSVPINMKDLFCDMGTHSLGENSVFDKLHHMDNVKFLFFGAEMSNCFTYVHYVEKMMNVPYRFDMPFKGRIIYPDETVREREQVIHTQCTGAVLPEKYDYFEEEMEIKGYLKKTRIGDKYISCISEFDAYREIKEHIDRDISYFLAEPFDSTKILKQYTFSVANGRITHC